MSKLEKLANTATLNETLQNFTQWVQQEVLPRAYFNLLNVVKRILFLSKQVASDQECNATTIIFFRKHLHLQYTSTNISAVLLS